MPDDGRVDRPRPGEADFPCLTRRAEQRDQGGQRRQRADERDQHAHAVENEEENVLTSEAGTSPVSKRPIAISEIRHRCCHGDTDNLGGNGFVVKRALPTVEAQQVEDADVENQCDEPNDAELGQFVDQMLDLGVARSPHRLVCRGLADSFGHRDDLTRMPNH